MQHLNIDIMAFFNFRYPAFSVLLVLVFFGNTLQIHAQGDSLEDKRTIMAIFAHPDDEMTVSPVLAKYADEGATVYLVICTDGRYGTNDFSGLEGGDGLVAIRKKEMECAADALGVNLIHLNYHDQLRAGEGYDGHVPHAQSLVKELHKIISEKMPDILITWGPDGGTTHMDHRLVGASVTQVYVSQAWNKPNRLFYVQTPSDLIDEKDRKILAGVNRELLKTQIPYSEKDLLKAKKALQCHTSQITPEGVTSIIGSRRNTGMTIYFREFTAPTVTRNDFFE